MTSKITSEKEVLDHSLSFMKESIMMYTNEGEGYLKPCKSEICMPIQRKSKRLYVIVIAKNISGMRECH